MSADTIMLRLGHIRPDVALRHSLLRGALLALIVGAIVVAVAMAANSLVDGGTAPDRDVAEAVVKFQTRELPAEWRFTPESVPVEHMYSREAPGRIDWIRRTDSGRRSGY